MDSSISIEDVNSIFITENSEGRIGFIFKSEDTYDLAEKLNFILSEAKFCLGH